MSCSCLLFSVAYKELILVPSPSFENGFKASSKTFRRHTLRRNTSQSTYSPGISSQGKCAQLDIEVRNFLAHSYLSIANLASTLLLRPERARSRLARDRASRAQRPIKHESNLSPPFRRLSLIEPKTQAAKLAMQRWIEEAAALKSD